MTRKELDMFRDVLSRMAFYSGCYAGTLSKEGNSEEAQKSFCDNYRVIGKANKIIEAAQRKLDAKKQKA